MKITYCPPGYAYGYSSENSSHDMRDLDQDTMDVAQPIIISSMLSFNRGKSTKDFMQYIKHKENKYSSQNHARKNQ